MASGSESATTLPVAVEESEDEYDDLSLVSIQSPIPENPIHEAAIDGDIKRLQNILDYNPDEVNVTDGVGRSPLHLLSLNGKLDAIKLLLEKGADIYQTDDFGRSPLHLSSMNGKLDAVKLLLEKGADINHTDRDGRTPLHLSSMNGKIDAMKLLLEKGANIHHTDGFENTAFHLAAQMGRMKAIKFLVQRGANVHSVNMGSRTPLLLSSWSGNIDAMKLLLEKGADIHNTDEVHYPYDPHQAGPIYFLTPRKCAIFGICCEGVPRQFGDTALHLAAWNGEVEAVELLVQHGANVHSVNNKGKTPLLEAVSQKKGRVVKYLINECEVDITKLDQKIQRQINKLLEESDSDESLSYSVTDSEDENGPTESATSQSDSIDTNLIMAYEAAMKEGSESSNQFKLVTLGAEGAGKTSSINTLLNLPFQPNQESTVGASVNKCTVDMHYTTSKWKKITATFQITEIPKWYKKEINAVVKLAKSDPVKPDAVNPDAVNPDLVNLGPINPVPQKPISQKVIDEVKEIIASKEEIPQDGHIRIVVFDIGGQEVYYDVHFLFLAIEDVALLVFDCSKGLDDPVISRHRTGRFGEKILTRGMMSNIETIELLLHSVYSRGQKAPDGSVSLRVPVVIMLGAHAEGLSDAQKKMIIQTICQRFYGKPFLEHLPKLEKEAFHFLSNSNPDPESVEHLRSTVLKAAEVVIATKRPISYLKFEGKILQKIQQAEVRLTRESAIDIARDAGVEGKQAIDALLRYFTNKGILLYYPEVKSLKNDVFISPQEVSDLVCAVITTHECKPTSVELQQSYQRYNQYALLEEPLLDFILLQFNRSKDKAVLLGLLDKFNLATEVPANTKFSHEIHSPRSSASKVFVVPPLLVYDHKVPYLKQEGDIVVQYYFPDKFLPESIFNQLLVKTIQWCCKHGHVIRCIHRGVGYFSFEDARWQQFQLQWCQSTSSINCYITIEQLHHPPSEMLPVLLQQRRQLLIYLESSVAEVSKCCMPSALPPLTCLECPLHEKECTPHVVLDINQRDVLVCHNMQLAKRIPEKFYVLLYQGTHVSSTTTLVQKPTMRMLVKWVIPEVAAHWNTLAYALDLKKSVVDMIKRNYPTDVKECCTEMFAHWLATEDEGTGMKTWEVLLNTLKDIDLIKAAGQIEMKLKHNIKVM